MNCIAPLSGSIFWNKTIPAGYPGCRIPILTLNEHLHFQNEQIFSGSMVSIPNLFMVILLLFSKAMIFFGFL